MTLVERVDDLGRPAWIVAVVLSFVMFWPVGLVLLGFLIGSGRIMGCWSNHSGDRWQRRMDRMQRGIDRMQEAAERWRGMGRDGGSARSGGPSWGAGAPSSGNRAFDEYRTETLRRLEDEQREFLSFLERLRHAKDKAEFDQFMAERRRQYDVPASPPQ